MESGPFMPPPGKGVRLGFKLAGEAAACRPFQLRNVLYGQVGAGGALCTLYQPPVL